MKAFPQPFVWSKTADDILASIERSCLRTSNSRHCAPAWPRLHKVRPRTTLFARYSLPGALCAALGALTAAVPDWLVRHTGLARLDALRRMFLVYAAVGVVVLWRSSVSKTRARRMQARQQQQMEQEQAHRQQQPAQQARAADPRPAWQRKSDERNQ